MDLVVGGTYVEQRSIQNYQQVLDMKKAILTTTFEVGKKASVVHKMMSLRHLPYTSLSIVEVTAHEDLQLEAISEIEAPNHLNNVRN